MTGKMKERSEEAQVPFMLAYMLNQKHGMPADTATELLRMAQRVANGERVKIPAATASGDFIAGPGFMQDIRGNETIDAVKIRFADRAIVLLTLFSTTDPCFRLLFSAIKSGFICYT